MAVTMDSKPWYRQFWPWFLIVLPGTVVVAGLSTVVIAVRHADNLVVDEYYKEGLAINRKLSLDRHAAEQGITARLAMGGSRIMVQLPLGLDRYPSELQLLLQHPTDREQDLRLVLANQGAGHYTQTLDAPLSGRWYITLKSVTGDTAEADDWRLKGEINLNKTAQLELSSRSL